MEEYTTEGFVKAVAQREKGYSLNINEEWFSGFGKSPVNKGDSVRVDFVINNTFKNIKTVTRTAKAAPVVAPIPASQLYSNSNEKTTVMREAYCKDILVALIENTKDIAIEDLTKIAIISFQQIQKALTKEGENGNQIKI